MRIIILCAFFPLLAICAQPGDPPAKNADSKPAEPTEEQLETAQKAYAKFGGELIPYKHPITNIIYAQFNFDKKKATFNDDDLMNLPDLPIAFMLDFESCAKVTDAGLKPLKKFKNLYGLGLRGTQVTDAGLKEIKYLTNITDLVLGQTKVTDEGLKELRELKNLTVLWLHDTSVTDVGVKELKELKKLADLSLGNTKVTDVGLKEIKNLTNLKSLELVGTQVTDAGLKELTGLKNLLELNLLKTKVTKEGVKELQKALPKCEIRS